MASSSRSVEVGESGGVEGLRVTSEEGGVVMAGGVS